MNYILAAILCLFDFDWWFPFQETRMTVFRDYLGKDKRDGTTR